MHMLFYVILVLSGDNMDIWLDKIDTNSSIDGLEVINKIAVDDEVYGEAPIDEEIDEYLYKGFLFLEKRKIHISLLGFSNKIQINLMNYHQNA